MGLDVVVEEGVVDRRSVVEEEEVSEGEEEGSWGKMW